jgi:hypothetical protein
MRDMTYLGEPQSAAGVPALVPDSWADQSWAAGMDGHLGQMTFGAITIPLFIIARNLAGFLWTLA